MSTSKSAWKPCNWPIIRIIFNGIPGPLIAKLTPFWKLYHVLRGSYRKAVGRLHERYGYLIQIGPNEFSLSNKDIVYMPKLARTFDAVDPPAFKALQQSLKMTNIYRYEHLIDECNHEFLCRIADVAETGQDLDLSPLLARYAYDSMLATTTGRRAGFLDRSPDVENIQSAVKSWKFYAVLFGSYLRFHPFITKILNRLGLRGNAQHKLFAPSERCDETDSISDGDSQTKASANDGQDTSPNTDLEGRIALTLAGADPAVVLIRTAVKYIYSRPELLQQLRDEISRVQLSDPPSFEELILQRMHMPLLHAVLLECVRLHPPTETGPSYTTREDNVAVGDHQLPKDTTISLEPTIAHVNPSRFGDDSHSWDPMRWLHWELRPELKRHLLAFNLVLNHNNIEQFQLLLTAKLLTQVITTVDMAFKTPDAVYDAISIKHAIFPAHGPNKRPFSSRLSKSVFRSLSPQERFYTFFQEDVAMQLAHGGSYDPARKSFRTVAPMITNPIRNPFYRALLFGDFKVIFNNKVSIRHDPHTDRMCIAPAGRIPRTFGQVPATQRSNGDNTSNQAAENDDGPCTNYSSFRTNKHVLLDDAQTKSAQSWLTFGLAEESTQKATKVDNAYEQQKVDIAQKRKAAEDAGAAAYERGRIRANYTDTTKVADTTATKTIPPHLRKTSPVNTTKVADTAAPKTTPPHLRKASPVNTTKVTDAEAPKAVPPHLRKRLLANN